MRWGKKLSHLLMMIILCLLIFYVGVFMKLNTSVEEISIKISKLFMDYSMRNYFAGMMYPTEKRVKVSEEWVLEQAFKMIPLGAFIKDMEQVPVQTEDTDTYKMILAMQARDENEVDENGTLINDNGKVEVSKTLSENISTERLKDYEYLVSNFYTVDSSTSVTEDLLNVETFLKKDMKLNTEKEGPKILIYHTHSQEAFKDSKKGESSDTIMGMGDYLAKILNEKYRIKTLHHKGVYDLIDGKLDRSKAYQLAEPEIRQILEKNPGIEVVIDLHRDGVKESTHLVSEINGKKTAQIMFFNGISRSRTNGQIQYLANPYIKDNLAFSFQMQLYAAEKFPGFTRRIYLKSYRYNMHLMPKTLLVEAGAQTNTVAEMKRAMEVLAEILDGVLT